MVGLDVGDAQFLLLLHEVFREQVDGDRGLVELLQPGGHAPCHFDQLSMLARVDLSVHLKKGEEGPPGVTHAPGAGTPTRSAALINRSIDSQSVRSLLISQSISKSISQSITESSDEFID